MTRGSSKGWTKTSPRSASTDSVDHALPAPVRGVVWLAQGIGSQDQRRAPERASKARTTRSLWLTTVSQPLGEMARRATQYLLDRLAGVERGFYRLVRDKYRVDEFYEAVFVEGLIKKGGRLVLGEAIGDLAGARIAFAAFQKALQRRPEPLRDGFTPEQQFFIAWGQFRGDAIRPELARTMVQGDPHPIAKYRVIGPVSNLPEFQKAFSCKPDAPMVRPANLRCEVW